jgi:hypothetical protein
VSLPNKIAVTSRFRYGANCRSFCEGSQLPLYSGAIDISHRRGDARARVVITPTEPRNLKISSRDCPYSASCGSYRAQLANMAKQAKGVLKTETLEAVADRGYFSSPENLVGTKPLVAAIVA